MEVPQLMIISKFKKITKVAVGKKLVANLEQCKIGLRADSLPDRLSKFAKSLTYHSPHYHWLTAPQYHWLTE